MNPIINENNIADDLLEELKKSKKEWELAVKQFDSIEDDDAITAATYKILAAERKYMHILKQIKDRGWTTSTK